MLDDHVRSLAQMTIACIDVPLAEASSFGVMAVDGARRVMAFQEKPSRPTPVPGRPDRALASMGIYVFDAAFLYDELVRDADDAQSSHDFGKDLIPRLLRQRRARIRSRFRRQLRQHQRRHSVLARRRDHRRLLGGEHRADARRARVEPLRQGLADLDLPGAVAAREVRVRRRRPARHGDRLDRRRRLHHQRLDRAPFPAVLERPRPRLLHDRGFGAPARRRCGPPLHVEEGGDRQALPVAGRAARRVRSGRGSATFPCHRSAGSLS